MKLKDKKIQNYLHIIMFLVVFLILLFFAYKHLRLYLDDDMSSDMVLGKLLCDEGKLFLTSNWMYTTELRVLTMQSVFALLFRFISNWFRVRLIGSVIIYLIMLVCLYLYCRKSNLEQYFYLIAVCFMMPLSMDTMYYTYMGLWYLVYIIYALTICTLLFCYQDKQNSIYLVVSFLLSIIYSLEGPRFILAIHLPLMAAAFFKFIFKDKLKIIKEMVFSAVALVGGFVGVLINKFALSKVYFIPGDIEVKLGFDFNKLAKALRGILENTGFDDGRGNVFFDFIAIFLVVLALICVVTVIVKLKEVDDKTIMIAMFYVFGVLGMLACFFLTNVRFYHRYLLVCSIFVIPMYFATSKYTKYSQWIIYIVVLLYLVKGSNTYISCSKKNKTTELDYIAQELISNDYKNGYSFFWSGNVLTELSNGEIEMWCWKESEYGEVPQDFKNIDEVNRWSQKKSHVNETPVDKVFIILTKAENEKFLDLIWGFTDDDILMQTSGFVIYVFDSYDELRIRNGYGL